MRWFITVTMVSTLTELIAGHGQIANVGHEEEKNGEKNVADEGCPLRQ